MTDSRVELPTAPRKRWRTVDGIVLLDKPGGLSSNQALQRVRRLLQAEKAGHAGTLDPLATGMLPLCFGQATKACGSLLGRRKAYRATLALGSATDTGDAEGAVVQQSSVPTLARDRIEQALAALRGERLQVPPMYSALKREGRPLYELARRGEAVEREARPVTIDALDLVESSAQSIVFEVTCSKGTYVRVLAEDIAAQLGTVGHLAALRRLWVEPFDAEGLVTLDRIESDLADASGPPAWLRPVDAAFPDLPRLQLGVTEALHVRQGRQLDCPSHYVAASLLRAYDEAGAFLGLLEVGPDQRLRVQRLFVAGAH